MYSGVKKFNSTCGVITMAVTKKSLISNSTSKKSTKKSSPKPAAAAITAAKLATTLRYAKPVPGIQSTRIVY